MASPWKTLPEPEAVGQTRPTAVILALPQRGQTRLRVSLGTGPELSDMSEGNGEQEPCQGAQLRYTHARNTDRRATLWVSSGHRSQNQEAPFNILEVPRMHLAGYKKWHSQSTTPRPVLFVGRP
jgi:hypothetical protein